MAHGGSQELSHSEQDDSSEKLGLISEAASPPGSPEQPPPDLALAFSNWVQFEDDTPWASTSPPHKETRETGGRLRRVLTYVYAHRGEVGGGCQGAGLPEPSGTGHTKELAEISSDLILQLVFVNKAYGRINVFWAISCFLYLSLAVNLSLEG